MAKGASILRGLIKPYAHSYRAYQVPLLPIQRPISRPNFSHHVRLYALSSPPKTRECGSSGSGRGWYISGSFLQSRYYSTRLPPRPPKYERFGGEKDWNNGRPFPSRYRVIAGGGALLGLIYVANLETVPISGRRRFNIVSPTWEKQIASGGFEAKCENYKDLILPPDHPYSKQVQRVLKRLVDGSRLQDEDWQYRVINDPDTKNAFVMPGGKVFVFTGILPICEDDQGLAAVLAHEIAHNVAHHVGERLSGQAVTLLIGLSIASVFDWSFQSVNAILAYLLSLPNSRTQELEADHIGLLMMAQACYDPAAAKRMWEHMEKEEVCSIA